MLKTTKIIASENTSANRQQTLCLYKSPQINLWNTVGAPPKGSGEIYLSGDWTHDKHSQTDDRPNYQTVSWPGQLKGVQTKMVSSSYDHYHFKDDFGGETYGVADQCDMFGRK